MTSQQQAANNKLFLSQLDQALGNSGLPPSQLNKLLSSAHKALDCDADCQRRKKIDELKKLWLSSKNEAIKLPEQIVTNKKNYIIATKGEHYYTNNVLRPQFQSKINTFIKKQQNEIEKMMTINNTILESYTSSIMALNRVNQLYLDVKNKNTQLLKDIDEDDKNRATSERRVFYESKDLESIYSRNQFIRTIYFIVIGLYAVLSLFYINGTYKNINFYIYIIFLILIPFNLPNFINYFYKDATI